MHGTHSHSHLLIKTIAFTMTWITALQAICDDSCLDCDGLLGECISCKQPPVALGIYKSLFRNACYDCPYGCRGCIVDIKENSIHNANCTSCQSNYRLLDNNTCQERRSSGSGTCIAKWCSQCAFFDPNICFICRYGNPKTDGTCYGPGELPPLCAAIDENGLCTACLTFILDNDKYRGAYFTPSTNTCSFCLENCINCESGTSCLHCNERFQLVDGQCV